MIYKAICYKTNGLIFLCKPGNEGCQIKIVAVHGLKLEYSSGLLLGRKNRIL